MEWISVGTFRVPEAAVVQGGGWRWIDQPCGVGLLTHPREGQWLVDTGLHPRLWQGPLWMKLFLLPARLGPAETLTEQLKARNFRPQGIFLTHLHLDHVGSLLDFPDLPVVTSREGFEMFSRHAGWRSGSDAQLFGSVIEKNGRWLEDLPRLPVEGWHELGRDLFGDGSARAVSLPGHAWGQHGLWLEGDPPTFLVADACGLTVMLDRPVGPRIPRYFCSDWPAAKITLERLRQLRAAHPEICFLPSHDPQAVSLGSGTEA